MEENFFDFQIGISFVTKLILTLKRELWMTYWKK